MRTSPAPFVRRPCFLLTASLLGCFAPGFFRLTRPFARFVLALMLVLMLAASERTWSGVGGERSNG